MRPYQRRESGAYPYFKLAKWNARNFCFDDGKRAFESEAAARAAADVPGRYRLSRITKAGREDLKPFDINPQVQA